MILDEIIVILNRSEHRSTFADECLLRSKIIDKVGIDTATFAAHAKQIVVATTKICIIVSLNAINDETILEPDERL